MPRATRLSYPVGQCAMARSRSKQGCVKDKLEWRQPGEDVFLPTAVDEGVGSDRIKIDMPSDLDLVVLHPDAAKDSSRREAYQSLGVRNCPPSTICCAIEKAQATPGTKFNSDLLCGFELLFWFPHKFSFGAQSQLIALASANLYAKSKGLFMRSDQPYHAERLLGLAENPQYNVEIFR